MKIMNEVGSVFHFVTRVLTAALLCCVSVAQCETWKPQQADVSPETIGQILYQADKRYDQEKGSHKERADGVTNQAMGLMQLAAREGKLVASTLRTGRHNVVSKDGELIVYAIQILLRGPKKNPSEYRDAESNLKAWIAEGRPEALTALGFFHEYGLLSQKRDVGQALALYRQAASSGYQPALYNIGLAEAYGKFEKSNLQSAMHYLSSAYAVAPDSSGRTCGMASFIAYRVGDKGRAFEYAKACPSPLAKLPLSLFSNDLPIQQRFDFAKASLASGIDDGFQAMKTVALEGIKSDNQFLYCKAYFLNARNSGQSLDDSDTSITSCIDWTISQMGLSEKSQLRGNALVGVKGYVTGTTSEIKTVRRSNVFHYSWSAPFLPFTQSDVIDVEAARR